MSTPSCSDWPVPPGLTLDNDASWSTIAPSQRKFEAREAVFLFPASSADRLFCISRGDLASGTFQMTQSDQGDADCVSMKVIIEYYPAHVFDLVKVCELKRKENQYGIGILTRKRPSRFSGAHFQAKVVVTLPKSGTDVLKLKSFETDMPLFPHQLDNLASTVHFRSISLRTSNVPILVESFSARRANIETSNAPVEGSFSASSSLNLITSNSHIRASVFLQNMDAANFSELTMKSSNGPIAASIILSLDPRSATAQSQSQASTERGGNFSVNATTQNGPLTLTFPSAPRSCNLQLRASGSLGPADVSPPKTYEGAFECKHPWHILRLALGTEVEDDSRDSDCWYLNRMEIQRSGDGFVLVTKEGGAETSR
ncbi:hypothetical protein BT96DRAFT_977318 [Gymnopus androsaceus JB14]|uniref:Uncharacterized protein n=1 Tax=Gymnopus androsaceus JB14 TaxID=1447944 RepID=A0A6A4HFW7_9AGAR|nr:hypothetical protein BT96DRAFT_977318 [Gymnopus androsaceus JB14]